MSEHYFTAEGAPCQKCNKVYLDDKEAGEACTYDPGHLTFIEIAAALFILFASLAVSTELMLGDYEKSPAVTDGR